MSVNFKMSFGCHRLDQNTNEFFSRISALAFKKRSNQKEARAEILEKKSLVFWSKRWHKKDILKLSDLYKVENFNRVGGQNNQKLVYIVCESPLWEGLGWALWTLHCTVINLLFFQCQN